MHSRHAVSRAGNWWLAYRAHRNRRVSIGPDPGRSANLKGSSGSDDQPHIAGGDGCRTVGAVLLEAARAEGGEPTR